MFENRGIERKKTKSIPSNILCQELSCSKKKCKISQGLSTNVWTTTDQYHNTTTKLLWSYSIKT